MKNANRVRRDASPATVHTQPKTVPKLTFEKTSAMLCLEENYNRALALPFCEAIAVLYDIYHLARHNPDFRKEIAALKQIIDCGRVLEKYCTKNRGSNHNEPEFNQREMAALEWFHDYFSLVKKLPFASAVHTLSGFELWINSPKFSEIGNAIVGLVVGGAMMHEFREKVRAL